MFFLIAAKAFAQEIKAIKISEKIEIDGVLDESAWNNGDKISDFIQFEPVYGLPSPYKTIVKILYDDTNIYFCIECLDPDTEKISAKITTRDGKIKSGGLTRGENALSLETDDAIGIMLDTFNDKNNGYFFLVNALGTQQDGKLADNGRTKDSSWDASWESAGSINADGWSTEIAVPFSSLKFNMESSEWGFNVGRSVPRNLEKSFWIANLTDKYRVSQFGKITGLDISTVSTKKYKFIPYAQSQFQKQNKSDGNIGLDVNYSLSSNLALDGTENPDFATVEGDVEQVNLTRFELSFPEKRPFFLEGAENYSTRIKQFYSRRIGEIPWRMKLNGKIDKWKLNFLSTQSDPSTAGADVPTGEEASFSVFRINRDIKNGSNIGIIGANRYYKDKNSGSVGLVGTLFFTDVLGMTSQFIKSYGEEDKGTWTFFVRPSFDSQYSHFHVRYSHTGEGIKENINPIGFIAG